MPIINSKRDLNIIGSQARGSKVTVDAGRDLNIESLQDVDTYKERNQTTGGSIGISASGKVSGSATANREKTDSVYRSVVEQAGIFAGTGGFDIEVGGNIDLKGAIISSEATPDKNRLSTGTLTWTDIENRAEYKASSIGVSFSSKNDKENNITKGITPNIGVPASGDADSTTHAAISSGTIEMHNGNTDLGGLSRDTENAVNALGKIFDKTTVQEQQELSKLFGEEAFKLVGNIAERAYLKAAKDDDKQGMALWGDGGAYKVALHAFVGGIMADIGGSGFTSGAVGAGVNEAVQKELKKIKDPALHQLAGYIVGSAAASIVGGNAQAGGSAAASGTKNNVLSHEEAAKMEEELSKCTSKEERRAVLEKWGKISSERDAQLAELSNEFNKCTSEEEIEAVYEKVANLYQQWGIADNGVTLVIGSKIDYNSLWEQMKRNLYSTSAYMFFHRQIAPIGQGFASSTIQNLTLNAVDPDLSNGANPRLYYFGKAMGDVVWTIGGTFGAIGAGGGAIVTSPSGVGAVAFGSAAVYSVSVAATSIYNLPDDFSRIFSSSGASGGTTNSEGPSKAGAVKGSLDELTSAERRVVDDLTVQGKNVEIIPRSNVPGGKTPDFKVDGVKTELKTLENPNTNTGMKRIQQGFEQGAETVIIDARQSGLNSSQAQEIIIGLQENILVVNYQGVLRFGGDTGVRHALLHYPGAVYYGIARGNNQEYNFLPAQINNERFQIRLFGYVFMNNHVHLIVEVNDPTVVTIMQ